MTSYKTPYKMPYVKWDVKYDVKYDAKYDIRYDDLQDVKYDAIQASCQTQVLGHVFHLSNMTFCTLSMGMAFVVLFSTVDRY